ncbi:MAG: biotin/lipoyl-binding protein [Candidatus Schekmanbacteria bacterium]|nr:MAG: biotin/lipoyl-binding protein [Candidatus Schekmanbacteria bacterium]
MRKVFKILLWIILIAGALYYIADVLKKSSPPPEVAATPVIDKIPVRIYGFVEPAGREVFVSPLETRRVEKIFVKEGDFVKKGQVLCILENSMELARLNLAKARLEASKKSLEINKDELKRRTDLFRKKISDEYAYTQADLRKRLAEEEIKVAEKEVELARIEYERLKLKSPIDGIVYKFDVRKGETLSKDDSAKIIIGSPNLWVRLYVESYWIDEIKKGMEFDILNTETKEKIGKGKVIFKSLYMGERNFRTEDIKERLDTRVQEVVLSLDTDKKDIPLGLPVMAEFISED